MTSIIERVDAAVKRLKDPKRPTKCLRVGQQHFATLIAEVNAPVPPPTYPDGPTAAVARIAIDLEHAAAVKAKQARQAAMQAEFVMPNGIICPPGPLGHWDGMRFVVVNGANDLDEVTT